jgi:hypothetical protein
MFVWDETDRLVIAPGVPNDWLARGVTVRGLPTCYGRIGYRLDQRANVVRLSVRGEVENPPPGGYAWVLPDLGRVERAVLNGREVTPNDQGEIAFTKLPAELEVTVR